MEKQVLKSYNIVKDEMRSLWKPMAIRIQARLDEFKRFRERSTEREMFAELAFCLFTPQSKAKLCWAAVETLTAKGLLLQGSQNGICRELNRVRFKNNKARYVLLARRQFTVNGRLTVKKTVFSFRTDIEAREWLVANVKGIGYKEAGHFLRNIGFADNLAILDRHILRNLQRMGVIDEIPATLSKARYLDIEKKMRSFADKIGIPFLHLDLLLWCRETGEIFK